jgi:hypothetical protein
MYMDTYDQPTGCPNYLGTTDSCHEFWTETKVVLPTDLNPDPGVLQYDCSPGNAPIATTCGACAPCPAGSFCTGGSAPAVPCTGAGGTYCPASCATNGVPCPSGSYCTGGPAPAVPCTGAGGTYCPASCATNGVPCPSGSYCTGGSAPAVQCALGTYSSTIGASGCTACVAGTVSNAQFTGCVPGPATPTAAAGSSATVIWASIAGGIIILATAIVLWWRNRRAAAREPPIGASKGTRVTNDSPASVELLSPLQVGLLSEARSGR